MTTRRVRAPLPRGGRRIARAGPAVQRDAVHGREPAARRRRAPGVPSEHRRDEGVGERHRADRRVLFGADDTAMHDFTVLAGSATTLLHALCAGCDGAILALAALAAGRMRQALDAGARGSPRRGACAAAAADAARALGRQRAMACPGLKAALDLMGFAGGPPRPPLRPGAPPWSIDAFARSSTRSASASALAQGCTRDAVDACSLAAVALLALAAACATNPVTGQREFSLMSEAQEICASGKESDPQIKQEMGVYNDPELQRYVSDIGQRMAKISERPDLPWQFTVVDQAGRQRLRGARRLHLHHARHPAVPRQRSRAGRRYRA